MPFADAHLDLAYLALAGRDLGGTGPGPGGPQPSAVTFSSLMDGGVNLVFGTIFTGAGYEGPCSYAPGDAAGAHIAGVRQLDIYRRWEDAGKISIVRHAGDLHASGSPLRVVLLMEGCDPIAGPGEAAWWHDRGMRVAGMSWWNGTRYAGGNGKPAPLTQLGKELASAFDDLRIIHDLSHLADESAYSLLDIAKGPAVATHSNARALMGGEDQRHLSDGLLSALAKRGGVVGLNLYSGFLTTEERRATLQEAKAHVVHMASVMGTRLGVGIGSDMDGGFGADRLPGGIDGPQDLGRLTDVLAGDGWTSEECRSFAEVAWLRFLETALPLEPTLS